MPKSRKRKYDKRRKAHRPSPGPQSKPDYVDAKVDLDQEVSEPSYGNVMEWIRGCGGRHVAVHLSAKSRDRTPVSAGFVCRRDAVGTPPPRPAGIAGRVRLLRRRF